jgi:DNA-binding LytR/AlgR family response regulator
MRSDHVYVEIHTHQDRHVIRMTLAKLEATLNSRQFMRIHRSHIVNLQHITRFDRLQVWVGEVSLGVGANYRDALMERLPIL